MRTLLILLLLVSPCWAYVTGYPNGSRVGVVSTSVVNITTRTTGLPDTGIWVEYSTSSDFSSPVYHQCTSTFPERVPSATNDNTALAHITGLTAGTTYYYRWVADKDDVGTECAGGPCTGSNATYTQGQFTTFPTTANINGTEIAIGSCWAAAYSYGIMKTIKDAGINYFINEGDQEYLPETYDTLAFIRGHINDPAYTNTILNNTDFLDSARSIGMWTLQDDHDAGSDDYDYGPNGTGGTTLDQSGEDYIDSVQAMYESFYCLNPIGVGGDDDYTTKWYPSRQWLVASWVPQQIFWSQKVGSVYFIATDLISYRDYYPNGFANQIGAIGHGPIPGSSNFSADNNCKSQLDDALAAGSDCGSVAQRGSTVSTTTTQALSGGETSITVADASAFPYAGETITAILDGTDEFTYTGVSGNTLTGCSGVLAHASGVTVQTKPLAAWTVASNQGEMADRTSPAPGTFLADVMAEINADPDIKWVVWLSSKQLTDYPGYKDAWNFYHTERDNLLNWFATNLDDTPKKRFIVFTGDTHSMHTFYHTEITGFPFYEFLSSRLGVTPHGQGGYPKTWPASREYYDQAPRESRDVLTIRPYGRVGVMKIMDHYIEYYILGEDGSKQYSTRVYEQGYGRDTYGAASASKFPELGYGSRTKSYGGNQVEEFSKRGEWR